MEQFELGTHARRHQRPVAGRLQAAPGHGGGAAARAGNPVPRRADQRRRSAGAPRVLAPHHRARRAGRDRHRHHALHAGGRVLRPRRDHGFGPRSWRKARRPRCARWRAPPKQPEPSMEDAFIAMVERVPRSATRRMAHAAARSRDRRAATARRPKLRRIRALVPQGERARSCAIPPASRSASCCR